MDVNSILPKHFNIVVDQMAKFVIACAREGRTNHDGFPFRRFLQAPKPRPAGHGEGFAAKRDPR
jgi:hypothetical protein